MTHPRRAPHLTTTMDHLHSLKLSGAFDASELPHILSFCPGLKTLHLGGSFYHSTEFQVPR
ncbi:unnamed protein product [Cyprideis torosa]|uniref:Uncharacterized protein n=1 Tax=Cyprideis torosa TaxID=163714 RepID=A0A7R8WM62_9CRUS|nr:unnamed protein product [Cyprideis torosa]CAG0905054.1 unnamed protein product [Cyprideis torosa]